MEACTDLLKRAVELDAAQRYPEALVCYEEGIQNLLRAMGEVGAKRDREQMRRKAEEYLKRAEQLKKMVKEGTTPERVRCVRIAEGATGYSYGSVFGDCLDSSLVSVELDDPYIRARHQLHNFVRFCELLVSKCSKLSSVELLTTKGATPSEESVQSSAFSELSESLRHRGVDLTVSYSTSLHDREARLSNGWVLRMGRGLDYFRRPPGGQFSIGANDFDLRPCHQTTIEIYHRLNARRIVVNNPKEHPPS